MAISFVSANVANATSISSITCQVGDLIVIAARGANFSITPPTVPGDVAPIKSGFFDASLDIAMSTGWKFAASTSESTGTWTNASRVMYMIYRGDIDTGSPIGASDVVGGSGTSLTIPGLTLANSDGTSWVGAFVSMGQGDTDLSTISSLTTRSTSGGTPDLAGFDTNGGVASFTGATDTGYISGNAKVAVSFEIKEAVGGSSPSRLSLLGAG